MSCKEKPIRHALRKFIDNCFKKKNNFCFACNMSSQSALSIQDGQN